MTALVGKRVRAIAAGPHMSCAMTDAGALYTWGENTSGDLGHGDTRNRIRPTLVTALDGIRVVGVSIDEQKTMALAANGSVYSFGEGPGLGIRWEGEVVVETLTLERIPNLTCMVPRAAVGALGDHAYKSVNIKLQAPCRTEGDVLN
jgi:hypothetical protein